MRDDTTRRVYPLRELDDYEVADHDPDVRGWTVYASDGLEIGEVEELFVDPAAKKVRYLAVDMKAGDSDRDKHRVLLPVGAARLRKDEDTVMLDSLSASEVARLPAYQPEAFDDAYEADLQSRLGQSRTGLRSDVEWYDNELYDDSRFYGSRRAR